MTADLVSAAQLGLGRTEDHVERQVEEDRSAVGGERGQGGVVQRPTDLSVEATVAAFLVTGGDERQVVDLLQAAGAPAELGCPPAEDDHRARR